MWETSCAPNAQQSAQTAPTPPIARSAGRRFSAATRVSRSIARVRAAARTARPDADPDDDQVRLRPPEQLAQGRDADPDRARVADGIERPVEGREESVVEDLQDDHQRERQSGDHGQDPSGDVGQDEGQRDQDEPLERDPQERARREILRLVGSDEDDPHEQRRRGP